MPDKFVIFPFTALVGQDLMKRALLLNAVDPSIGGVIIRGDKGTGKSTAVRALAHMLPRMQVVEACPFNCDPENVRLMCKDCRERFERERRLPVIEKTMEIIDMPLSATEDMVIGTIDIQRVLADGLKALEPGILARANKNILYIDEVNLLDDHLINILLDAAAMGVNIVEREGISLYHPSRFILVGTMNPEEGTLRPQILDRFGLCVEVHALASKQERLEVMQRRKAFDLDCWGFEERFYGSQEKLRSEIITAQKLLPEVAAAPDMLDRIVTITSSLGIKTHRADIVMEKTACALAALDGRTAVNADDVTEAALLALPHRMRQQPFERAGSLDRQTIENILQDPPQEHVEPLDREGEFKKKPVILPHEASSRGTAGHRASPDQGLYIKARSSDHPRSLALDATLRKTVRETGTLQVLPEHLMEKVRRGRAEALYILVLDASTSMRMDKKVRLVKTLSWHLLRQSYEQKNRIALISFRGEDVRVQVEPTRDHERIEQALEQLPAGGKTPLTPALQKAFVLAEREKNATPVVILISDGRGNIFFSGSLNTDLAALHRAAPDAQLTVINAEQKHRSVGVLEEIATLWQAPHFYLEELL